MTNTEREQDTNLDQTIPYDELNETIPNTTDQTDETLPYSNQRTKDGSLRLGTLNVNGLKTNTKDKLQDLAKDMDKYKLDILAIQETHIDTRTNIKVSTGLHDYNVYLGQWDKNKTKNIYTGTGFITRNDLKLTFTEISDRITYIKLKSEANTPTYIVTAYAPTLPNSERFPQDRQDFYDQLDSLLDQLPRRATRYVLGDFNAKTGDSHTTHPRTVGQYGKGQTNSNGQHLIGLAERHNMTLANTRFRHKLAHIATWTRNETTENRRNPVRNQIDYCLVETRNIPYVTDSRSYSGLHTDTDHRLVKTTILDNMKRQKKNKTETRPQPDILMENEKRQLYQQHVRNLLQNDSHVDDTDNEQQATWTKITTACNTALTRITDKKTRHTLTAKEKELKRLSQEQKKLKNELNSTTDKRHRRHLKTRRNAILTKLHNTRKDIDCDNIERQIAEIERTKDNTNKAYKAIRKLTALQKAPLLIQTEDGLTTNEEMTTKTITDFFTKMFTTEDNTPLPDPKPIPMTRPFTIQETKTALSNLRNNKSAGIDNIYAEQLKYGPDELHKSLTDLLNSIASTGNFPKELRHGVLIPLQKPGKARGPPSHLRPIILLSMIRKLLATCLIKRITAKLNDRIPVTQTAYRKGRNTTEHILTIKLLCERATTSTDLETHLLLLDMTKAFDTVDRQKLLDILKTTLDKDEYNLTIMLLKDVELTVRNGQTTGQNFKTTVGIPQGDCLSATFFTLYLAQALDDKTQRHEHLQDHTYCKLRPGKTGHNPSNHTNTNRDIHKPLTLDLQYADDITYISNTDNYIEDKKTTIPEILKQSNLTVNTDKTEQHLVKRGGDENWKDCRYLGSLLDTDRDIQRRKTLANMAFNKYRHILTSTKLPLTMRLRTLNAYVKPIFLYNAELWTMTQTLCKEVDTFQRNLLRRALKIHWPYTISNTELYRRTKEKPWSTVIKKNRVRLTGHLLRLPDEAPVRLALKEVSKPTRRPRGRPKKTWVDQINSDLQQLNLGTIHSRGTFLAAQNRRAWRDVVGLIE